MGTIHELKLASLRLFARHGYEGATLAEVASAVGIKKPSIYAHFQGKEELYLAVFEEVLQEHVLHIEQFIHKTADKPVGEKLFRILSELCTFYVANEDKHAFLKRSVFFPPKELEADLRTKFLEAEQALTDLVRSIFQEALDARVIREESLDDLLASFYCLIDGNSMQLFYYGQENFLTRLESTWKIYWSGLTCRD